MGLPNSSGPMPEGSPPNLPVLPPSSALPEEVSLLLLPEELELLPELVVESKFVESLNTPTFYTFLTPDKDGEFHGEKAKSQEGSMNGECKELKVYKSYTYSCDPSCLFLDFEPAT